MKVRCRKRGLKVPLPTVTFGNVRSVRNKCDELETLVKYQHDYKDSRIIGLTETWLQGHRHRQHDEFTGFTLIRSDRTEESNKERDGGVCANINSGWCKNINIIEKHCDQDIELLTLGLRLHYLPREIPYIIAVVVYVPPSADTTLAADKLCDTMNLAKEKTPRRSKDCNGRFQ